MRASLIRRLSWLGGLLGARGRVPVGDDGCEPVAPGAAAPPIQAPGAVAGRTRPAPVESFPAPPPVALSRRAQVKSVRFDTIEESHVYKTTARGELRMHIVRPMEPPPKALGRPCMVFFHGGGWRRPLIRQFQPFCDLLAQRGIVGMCAEFRLLQAEELIPVEAVADARSAMRWVRRHAARFGCDPARIGAAGGSSGGHLALMTALHAPVDDPDDELNIDSTPALLVLLNAPLNFDGYASSVPETERRRFSPYHLLDASLPPTLALHGTRDQVVSFRQLLQFQELATALEVKQLKVVPFEGRGHGFFNRGNGEPGDFARTALEIAEFLGEHGWM
jgi:acetyl esterase/lipase